jgi:hypothetical protein
MYCSFEIRYFIILATLLSEGVQQSSHVILYRNLKNRTPLKQV